MTIDEQLLPFRGRCSFKQYIPSKPARYGIKTFALVDLGTFYTFNLETYLGTQPDRRFEMSNKAMDVVLRLVEPIKNSGRNITADNWFASIELIKNLAKLKLSYLRTMRKNKPQIPLEFLPCKDRPLLSSLFAFLQVDKYFITLVSYVPKKKKAIVLASSMHADDAVDLKHAKRKPEMILDYNSDKCGVDMVDQMCATYSVQRTTRRWPWVAIANLLNISAINAHVVYYSNHRGGRRISRYQFLQNLGRALILPQIAKRSNVKQVHTSTRRRCLELIGAATSDEAPVVFGPLSREKPNQPQKLCFLCKNNHNHTKNSRHSCAKCFKHVCSEHFYKICDNCIPK